MNLNILSKPNFDFFRQGIIFPKKQNRSVLRTVLLVQNAVAQGIRFWPIGIIFSGRGHAEGMPVLSGVFEGAWFWNY